MATFDPNNLPPEAGQHIEAAAFKAAMAQMTAAAQAVPADYAAMANGYLGIIASGVNEAWLQSVFALPDVAAASAFEAALAKARINRQTQPAPQASGSPLMLLGAAAAAYYFFGRK